MCENSLKFNIIAHSNSSEKIIRILILNKSARYALIHKAKLLKNRNKQNISTTKFQGFIARLVKQIL